MAAPKPATEGNEERRRELFLRGADSLYFFAQGILGFEDLEFEPHMELCENLLGRGSWGDWRQGLVCASRGFLKSSICTIAFPLHQAIYRNNFSSRIIGSSWENAKLNFFMPMLRMFTVSNRRNFLHWLYDRCICNGSSKCPYCGGTNMRLMPNMEGTNESQLVLSQTDPLAKPAITFKGIASDQEGYHGNLVILDDPEGADAEKSDTTNTDALRAWANSTPLLIDPMTCRILTVCTPHGDDPLAWRLLEDDQGNIEWDNRKRAIKVWWKPIVNSEGKPNWPERFSDDRVELLRQTIGVRAPKVFEQQYLLRKTLAGGGMFDMASIKAGFWQWKIRGRIIDYPVLMLDPNKWYGKGVREVTEERRTVHMDELRFYIHFDPIHKEDPIARPSGTSRPSRAAIVVCGVAPDGHVFVLATWSDQVSIDKQLAELFRHYRMFGPFHVTYDPTGAQYWIEEIVKTYERSNPAYQFPRTTGLHVPSRRLPSLSSRIVADRRSPRQSKEEVIQGRLEPWFNERTLHLEATQDEILHQLAGFPDNTTYVDLVDALAQGPVQWLPPGGRRMRESKTAGERLMRALSDPYTGYIDPWTDTAGSKPSRLLPLGSEREDFLEKP